MKRIRAFMKKAKIRKNKKGGIEGLPLQLLIIIVVATLGLSTMVGWMNNIEEPTTIDKVVIDKKVASSGDHHLVTFYVYDNKGNPVEGANVVISNLGATAYDENNVKTDYSFLDTLMDVGDALNTYVINPIIGMFGSDDDSGSDPAPAVTAPTAPSVPEEPEHIEIEATEEPEEETIEVEVQETQGQSETVIEVISPEVETEEMYDVGFIDTVTGSRASAPIGVTDENGMVTIAVCFTGLDGYGYFHYEVSKNGYGTLSGDDLVN